MKQSFHKFVFNKILGWRAAEGEGLIPEDKAVILAAPHTSIYDFVVGFFYYRSLGGRLTIMIKKEAFFWPLGPILRRLGAFPMDRKHPQKMMMSIIHEMSKPDTKCMLTICPEGTRKAVHKWKTGYHTIARECNVPVYLAHLDYKTRVIGSGSGNPIPLTDDARADTDRIQQLYEDMNLTALHPEGYTTK